MFGAVILGFAVIVNSQAGVSKISLKIIILNGCVQYIIRHVKITPKVLFTMQYVSFDYKTTQII